MDQRFRALRVIASLLDILAWVVLVLGIVGGILVIAASIADLGPLRPYLGELAAVAPGAAGTAGGAMLIALSLLYFVVLLAAAQWVQVALAIEENTRYTGKMLRYIWDVLGPPKKAGDKDPPQFS